MQEQKTPLEHITLQSNGLTFEALAAGPRDGELVLLLHGFPQFADAWSGLMGSLAKSGFRAVAVNQRGYAPGARPAAVEAYAMRELVADVIGFAEALGAERFHLAGHDWGGAVAWAVAGHFPKRLLSLTVLSTPHLDAFAHALTHDAEQMRKSLYMALFKAPGHVAEMTFLAFDAKVLRGVYQNKVPAEQVERNVERLREHGALTAALNWYRANTFAGGLGTIRVPTLYLWGDQDMALGETAALATAAHVEAPYRFARLAGASHWLLEEVPEQVRSLVTAHLQANAHMPG